jgi:glc operon protein GlcG
MIDLKLEMAETAVKTAQAKARALGTPMTITVVDEAGRLVLSARGDGTGFLTPETSRAKATAAAAFRKTTAELVAQGAKGWGFWQVMPIVAQGEVLPTLGGAPIVVGGRVIGGIGCGGGTGEQDQECADAGAAAVKA